MSRARTCLCLALIAAFPPVSRGDDAVDGGTRRTVVRTMTGKIASFSSAERKLTVDVPGGPIALVVDRNTAIYLEDRIGTIRDLIAGAPVRVAFGEDQRAFWLEVQRRAVAGPESPTGAGGGMDAGNDAGPVVLPAPEVPAPNDGGPPDAGAAPRTDGGDL